MTDNRRLADFFKLVFTLNFFNCNAIADIDFIDYCVYCLVSKNQCEQLRKYLSDQK